MSVRYSVTELCCALKPASSRHLLATAESRSSTSTATCALFAPLDGLDEQLAEHPFLLTPHLLAPLPDDGREPSELAILLAGSLQPRLRRRAARAPRPRRCCAWWAERLRTGSRLRPAEGMVYDQRWADLMPGLFEGVGLWRDPGVNSGYWRAATSSFDARRATAILVDGQAAAQLSLHRLSTPSARDA